MKIKRRKIGFFSGLFGLLGLFLIGAGIYLALANINSSPMLVQQPKAAMEQVTTMLDALCDGEYQTVSKCLYGNPNLGMDGEAADQVGQMFWEKLTESFTYEIRGDFHATDSGVALDVTITCLDLDSVTGSIRERARAIMEARIDGVEDLSEIYDENYEFREEFVMDALAQAVEAAIAEEAQMISRELTLNLVYEGGQWWIMPEQDLLRALSGGILS